MHSSIRPKPRVRWVGHDKEWRATLGNSNGQAPTIDGAVLNLFKSVEARVKNERNAQRYANHMQHVHATASERA